MSFQMKKQFGQHFLRQVPKELLFPIDELEKLQSLQKPARVVIIEIGPGSGNVTQVILEQLLPFTHLTIDYQAVDIDTEAINATKERVAALKLPRRIKFSAIKQDILRYEPSNIEKADFLYIFGSLPYNVSKKIVNYTKQLFVRLPTVIGQLPSRFIIQKEVGEDYVSVPPSASYLGSELSLYTTARKITRKLPPGAFYPPPKVESVVLELWWRRVGPQTYKRLQALSTFMRRGFTARRKVIGSVFKSDVKGKHVCATVTHLLTERAHELSTAEWELLYDELSAK